MAAAGKGGAISERGACKDCREMKGREVERLREEAPGETNVRLGERDREEEVERGGSGGEEELMEDDAVEEAREETKVMLGERSRGEAVVEGTAKAAISAWKKKKKKKEWKL